MIKRALVSVSDKTGIVEFAKGLAHSGIELVSTGGTAHRLRQSGLQVTGISEVTGFPECLDGRVKTLHPKVHAGLLADRSNPDHMKQLDELGITPLDMVVVNLYPFRQTIQKVGTELEEAIENIDIGGPTMLRSAAKNYSDVVVVTDPADYEGIIAELKETGDVSIDTKFRLACRVFEHTCHYDTLIAEYLRIRSGAGLPRLYTMTYEKVQDMRYGENPHQKAIFYKETAGGQGFLTDAVQLHGKELSFNNINDTNGALDLLKEFEEPAVIAVKHANPCGVGTADSIHEAYIKAYEGDPVSIFGGIIAANRQIDAETAEKINSIFIEVVVAPSYSQDALRILKGKKNIRILTLEGAGEKVPEGTLDMKKVRGGLLVQDYDSSLLNMDNLEYVTDKKPTEVQMQDLVFAMKVVKHTKSNGIALAKDRGSIGIGPGQLNRIQAVKIAVENAGEKARGAVLASDAFFPFDDWVEVASKAGIAAVIQPGGSRKDSDSIESCNTEGIAMVFTGMRHFKH